MIKKKKLTIGLVYGGDNSEHEINLMASKDLITSIDRNEYEIVVLFMDRSGNWHFSDDPNYLLSPNDINQVSLNLSKPLVYLSSSGRVIEIETKQCLAVIDVFFPSTLEIVQAYLTSLNVPIVGCDIFGTVIARDKDITKRLLRDNGLPIVPYLTLYEQDSLFFSQVVEKLGTPLFVKPARLGSSIGVSQVKDEIGFQKALVHAFQYDQKVLIEQSIDGKEVQCAIIGNKQPQISKVFCEVINTNDFFTLERKTSSAELIKIPAAIAPQTVKILHEMALKAFFALECQGMVRIDFFLQSGGNIYINEINTNPGLGPGYTFPRLWKASGVSYSDMIDQLIASAIEHHHRRQAIKTRLTN